MTSADMMVVFDFIILILGIYIWILSFKMKKTGVVASLFVAAEEAARCRDTAGFIAYLFPRGLLFGLVSIVFGAEGICNDLIVDLGQVVNIILLLIFIAAWVWFSMQLRKGKEKFF